MPSRHAISEPEGGRDADIAVINKKLRELAAEALSGKDYGDVGDALGIPRRQVSFYTAPTSDKNVPLAIVIPWYRAFGSCEPLEWLVAQLGLSLATAEDRALAEYGRLAMEVHERQDRMRELMREVA